MRVFLFFILLSFPVFADNSQSFSDWLIELKKDALARGINQYVVDSAFVNIYAPNPAVIELDTKQPEHKKLFSEYKDSVVTRKKINATRKEFSLHRSLLKKIENKYKVPAQVILALWGIESNFGKNQGNFSVIESLASLAYDCRRSQFFREELLNALLIMQQENIASEDLTGSWAGAMGQTQFMPSSFIKFAVDFNHDGKKDIWNTDADALASIANYLHQRGWKYKQPYQIAVKIPESLNEWKNKENTLKEWNKLGIKKLNGKNLPKNSTLAKLVIPDDNNGEGFLTFANYNVIMDWNRSIYFASSVGLLADKIGNK